VLAKKGGIVAKRAVLQRYYYTQVVRQIQEDIMNVLNGYAEELYKADRHWRRHIPQLRNWTYTFPYNWRARSAKTKRK
jgi:hypothetical protein